MRGSVHQHSLPNLCNPPSALKCSSVRPGRQGVYYSRQPFMAGNVVNGTISFNMEKGSYAFHFSLWPLPEGSRLGPNVGTERVSWYTFCGNQYLLGAARKVVERTLDYHRLRISRRPSSIPRARISLLRVHWARAYFGSTASKRASNLYLGAHEHAYVATVML